MTTGNNSSQRSTTAIGLTIIVIVIIAVIGVLLISKQNSGVSEYRRVTYQAEATGGYVYIIYTDSNGKNIEATMVSSPFTKTVALPTGQEVYLTASNPSATGTVSCKIRIDNADWKESHGTHPVDSVACGGIIK